MSTLLRPRLRAKGAIPYGGRYALNLPEKGFVGEGPNFDMLMTAIRKYRIANGFVIGLGLEDEIERELCKVYPAECDETDERIPQRTRAGWQSVLQFTKVMLQHWWHGREVVSQDEANRRASICARCPNNCAIQYNCAGRCGELVELARVIAGSKSTPDDGKLNQCGICTCDLQAAVWVPLDYQLAVLTDDQRAQFAYAAKENGCWKHRENG